MKAICKKAFTDGASGRDYKPGDELECSEKQFEKLAWHNYVCKPEDAPENETEEAADEGGSKSDDAESTEEGGDVPESDEASSEETS